MTQTDTERVSDARPANHFDVIVIGAGSAGLYELHLMRQRGLSVRVLEAGSGVGGTWYWNRYPGARLDSESYSYQYAFTEDLLQEWDWSELFAGQPELEAYFNKVADNYDLRKDIQFDTRVESAVFDPDTDDWTLTTDGGETFTSRLVVAATGVLSAPIYPDVPGIETFQGETYHTATWPDKDVTFEGKKVVIIGTGATGIQLITEVAKNVGHLTVFQRTPNWAVPLRNRPLSAADMAEIRAGYPEMFAQCRSTFGGFLHSWDPIPSTEYTEPELVERFEKAYAGPGFSKWFGLPNDVATDAQVNRKYCDFLADKIRRRVDDPATAEKLIPKDHLFGTKRVPCESGYYESYNRENVDLVSLADNPLLEFTPTGVRTADGEIEADMILFATGFEAFTGALNRIDITGVDGRKLRDQWADGPVTYLGIQVSGFPNFFVMGGPHGKGGHGNSPRCAESVLEWMAELAEYVFKNGIKRVEADPAAQKEWTDQVHERAQGGLGAHTKSAFYGDNVPGRKRVYLAYVGALPEFVERLRTLAETGYPGFVLTK
jgi:cation diffusion facilitator CzcD-associated flavoprotein CzcO